MKLKNELKATKAKLEDTQNELTAWKFTPDSNTGKRLMAKCRLLYQENEELGKIVSNGRLAKLESDLSLHRNFVEELRRSQSDVESIIQDLDVDVEGLTSTIILLQQKLKTSDERILQLESEVKEQEAPKAEEEEQGLLKEAPVEYEPEEPLAKKPCLEVEAENWNHFRFIVTHQTIYFNYFLASDKNCLNHLIFNLRIKIKDHKERKIRSLKKKSWRQ